MYLNSVDKKLENEMAYEVARLFLLDKKTMAEVTKVMKGKYDSSFSSQNGYELLKRCADIGLLEFVPILEKEMQKELMKHFGLRGEVLKVVRFAEDVPIQAAMGVSDFIKKEMISRQSSQESIGVGFGPGIATKVAAEWLSRKISTFPVKPNLHLYALTGGGLANDPEVSPISFFGLFEKIYKKTAMFAPSLVTKKQFFDMQQQPGVVEVFEAKKEGRISVVITAMGDAPTDKDIEEDRVHDLLSKALLSLGKDQLAALRKKDHAGNIQYRPYDSMGKPILENRNNDYRAPTVLELRDLQNMAFSKSNFIALMAREKQARTVIPLLRQKPEELLFDVIYLDRETALAIGEAEGIEFTDNIESEGD